MDQPTRPSRAPASSLAIWAGLLTIYLVWGSTYLGIAIAVETMPPFVMAAIRFVIAGLLLASLVALRDRRAIRRPSRRELVDAVLVGTLLVAVGNGLVSWGEQTVPSGITALLVGLMPAWLALIARVAGGDRLPTLAGVGIGLGLVGVAILAWPFGTAVGPLDPAGLGAVLVAPIGWATGSFYASRRARLPSPPLFATALQMLAGGAVLGLVATLTGEVARFDPAAVSDRSLVALAYLTLIGSLLAYTTYAWLLSAAPLSKISTYAYVNPVVAVVLGAVVLGEPITLRTAIAAGVIVAAVALVVSARAGWGSRSEGVTRPVARRPRIGRPEPAIDP
ncbi:MAG TPA: EamA family transporter [Candidatus Limnocylindrales bacterium]|nr:EamA family transporter [Candidatus Limnocylindrales bacterium]